MARRDEPIYFRRPEEGLPGVPRFVLLQVMRGVVGFANSPRSFWRYFRNVFLDLGAKQLILDKAVCVFYDKVDNLNVIILIVGVHVDDLIGTYRPGH